MAALTGTLPQERVRSVCPTTVALTSGVLYTWLMKPQSPSSSSQPTKFTAWSPDVVKESSVLYSSLAGMSENATPYFLYC